MKEKWKERLTVLSPPPEPLRTAQRAARAPPEVSSLPSFWSLLNLNASFLPYKPCLLSAEKLSCDATFPPVIIFSIF